MPGFNRLSVNRKCVILCIPRSSLHYKQTREKIENPEPEICTRFPIETETARKSDYWETNS
ncbi:hypothetical protein SAMN05444412_11363 [Rhodonellum ikkaensis]|uniref:Uncharacterized protein n=1 Tax=Rhodonellum ikkaensis TaxID=336829 RepID=A0A1H3SRQ6_9BACT|nr:hypothetical protein SAMN05444412_11363 [Rhodonellum ikkaensis]